jgi:hypothetical protein
MHPLDSSILRHALTVMLTLAGATALGQTWSTQPQGAAPTADALKLRLEADFKLCAQEPTAQARAQCRRDAQTVYDQSAAQIQPLPKGSYGTQPSFCAECGHVLNVQVADLPPPHPSKGAVGNAVANTMMGTASAPTPALAASAARGAATGKVVQEALAAKRRVWTVTVRYTQGSTEQLTLDYDPNLKVGDAVMKSGQTFIRH